MKILFYIIASIVLIINQSTFSQTYPTDYFRSPLDIPLYLSGTFGELRSNHFHSGMDIRTQEKPGFKLYAIADGYVSRIKVAPGGYGRALYITHPNGFVSVYGHLQKYNKIINEYVTKEQYRRESYSVDLYFKKGQFPVKKGEVIARTGDSGRSGGPHLHFEIRDEATQKPINPLLFGFKVEDKNRPLINVLKVYPADNNSLVNGKSTQVEIYTDWTGTKYGLKGNDTIEISGKAYFGINTYDPFNAGNNKNGVYSIKLSVDSTMVYAHKLETFSFDETRYINSFMDYKEFKQKRRTIQKSYIQPNNRLSIYKDVINRGIISFNDNSLHKVVYSVSDIPCNTSYLEFWVRSVIDTLNSSSIDTSGTLFTYTGTNIFKKDGVKLTVPGKALYDTLNFKYSTSPAPPSGFSRVYHLHYNWVPLQTWCELAISAKEIPENLTNKVLIANLQDDGEISPAGGKYKNGNITTRIRNFGNYFITIDTIPPEIKAVNIRNGKDITNQNTIKVRITDDLSGIKSYRPTLNGKWVLMEYDVKNNMLIYRYDDRLKKGENIFEVKVTDEKGNISTYKAKVILK
jgi:murein DD-endopeptidase MepM/ murein hydrolase activator NlpD